MFLAQIPHFWQRQILFSRFSHLQVFLGTLGIVRFHFHTLESNRRYFNSLSKFANKHNFSDSFHSGHKTLSHLNFWQMTIFELPNEMGQFLTLNGIEFMVIANNLYKNKWKFITCFYSLAQFRSILIPQLEIVTQLQIFMTSRYFQTRRIALRFTILKRWSPFFDLFVCAHDKSNKVWHSFVFPNILDTLQHPSIHFTTRIF